MITPVDEVSPVVSPNNKGGPVFECPANDREAAEFSSVAFGKGAGGKVTL